MSETIYTTVISLGRKADRKRFCEDLRRHVLSIDGVVEERVAHRGRELIFRFDGPGISASTWLRPEETDWLIAWHNASKPLAPMPGIWESVNQHHRHKATSFARSLDDVIRRLVAGFQAAKDGSAFLE